MSAFKQVIGYLLFIIVSNFLLFALLIGPSAMADYEPETQARYIRIDLPKIGPLYALGSKIPESPEIECLAKNIYHEARDQSIDGQLAVAFVTMNRVMHVGYPDSVCEVVYEPYQFSWTHEGKSLQLDNPIEDQAWATAVEVAQDVLSERVPNNMYGVTHYHADWIDQPWPEVVMVKQIDNHIFYRHTSL